MLTDTPRPGGAIRSAVPTDLPMVAQLCAAHVAFERAEPVSADLAARLESALFAARPRAWCFVADHEGELVGYVTCSLEFSTWQAADYLHLGYVGEQGVLAQILGSVADLGVRAR
ncbi:GNAT family N-acetyltransferase [Streptomyces sp. NPDC102467]|uniref:GNAT family N-acetyltransferase n=1 Tax=Streptomyces sp. NPDC102467 TaxID=3366179 RepID=UPI00381C5063